MRMMNMAIDGLFQPLDSKHAMTVLRIASGYRCHTHI